jgi:hypothetical protein
MTFYPRTDAPRPSRLRNGAQLGDPRAGRSIFAIPSAKEHASDDLGIVFPDFLRMAKYLRSTLPKMNCLNSGPGLPAATAQGDADCQHPVIAVRFERRQLGNLSVAAVT